MNTATGYTKQAMATLQRIHDTNHRARGDTTHELVADLSAEPQPVDPGLTEISRSTESFMQRAMVRLMTAIDEILTGTKMIVDVSCKNNFILFIHRSQFSIFRTHSGF